MAPMFITRPRPKKDAMTAPPRKKRKADAAIEEISFDDSARSDYLTGFHKRKLQRQKQAQEIAAEKARVERITLRKEVREERKRDLENHIKSVNDALKAARRAGGEEVSDSEEEGEEGEEGEEEWDGIDDGKDDKPTLDFVDHEEEYVDEDKYTTVTVEAVDVDREGMHALSGRHASDSEASGDESSKGKADGKEKDDEKAEGKKDKKEWPKKVKKKKFRYENKLERQLSRTKNKKKR